jgi:Protein of unknown function (DUF1479)
VTSETQLPHPQDPSRPRELSGLPHWDETPTSVPEATRIIKQAIREEIERQGRTVANVVEEIEDFLLAEIDDIESTRSSGREVWPIVEFEDIQNGGLINEQSEQIRRRGCVVVRGTFDRTLAERWDRDVVEYVEKNLFFENYRGPGDDFFETVESKPEIYPIYWSRAQMEARQHPHMAGVRTMLNRCWKYESNGTKWFDPDRDLLYPDRLRRRPPGTNSGGLGTHLDPGTLDLWMSELYQEAFSALYRGDFASYDPWDASHRTNALSYPGSTMCSAFRTFQGWTALSEMSRDQGVLHTVPIPKAFGYLLLRPLLDDVAEDDLCGVRLGRTFPVNERFHSILSPALSGIPDIEPGDTVWWHCDMIHSVAPVTNQQGWGNVLYIPAAPWCEKNANYAERVREAFLAGRSPDDFPEEHYEVDWVGRFTEPELTAIGRSGMGFEEVGT